MTFIIKIIIKLNLDLFNEAGYPRRGELLRTPIFYFTMETIWKKRHIRMGDLNKQAWQNENPHYYNVATWARTHNLLQTVSLV